MQKSELLVKIDEKNENGPLESGQKEIFMRCFRKKMTFLFSLSHKYKRTLQAMAISEFVIYMTLVLYQNVCGYTTSGGNGEVK